MDKQKGTFTAKQIIDTSYWIRPNNKQYHRIFPKREDWLSVDAYFLPLICLRWWKTLMTSRIRRGASSILEARLMHAIATIWREDNWCKKFKGRVQWLSDMPSETEHMGGPWDWVINTTKSKGLSSRRWSDVACLYCSSFYFYIAGGISSAQIYRFVPQRPCSYKYVAVCNVMWEVEHESAFYLSARLKVIYLPKLY